MFELRRANLADLEALIILRLELLREVGDLKDDIETTAIATATRKYLAEKIPQNEFLVWIAEVENQIVATSGLVLFTRPPYNGHEKLGFISTTKEMEIVWY